MDNVIQTISIVNAVYHAFLYKPIGFYLFAYDVFIRYLWIFLLQAIHESKIFIFIQ